jgi:hypothetical protein
LEFKIQHLTFKILYIYASKSIKMNILKQTLLLCALLAVFFTASSQVKTIPFDNNNISYQGRILFRADAAELSWPGTSVSILFEGDSIRAVLQDLDTANYYQVIVDDQPVAKIHTDTTRRSYLLAAGLSAGKHTLELFKRTEWDKGKTLFYGLETTPNTHLFVVPEKKRKMEFFGNSITCGYAMEDTSGNDSGYGYFENAYLSYAALTARHFNARFHSTSKSGIGIMVSWFPLIMPEMYYRLDPLDPASKWDFNKYIPDIVVINLFQNDSWLIKNHAHEQFKNRFDDKEPGDSLIIASYKNFVSSVRKVYPKAHIICALGSMDATRKGSPWPLYIEKAVAQLNDARIYTHFFPYKNTPGHPKIGEQKAMADSLIRFIEENISW